MRMDVNNILFNILNIAKYYLSLQMLDIDFTRDKLKRYASLYL